MRARFVAFLEEAPTVEIDANDNVRIKDNIGQGSVERVMSIHSLQVYLERGRRALVEWSDLQSSKLSIDGKPKGKRK